MDDGVLALQRCMRDLDVATWREQAMAVAESLMSMRTQFNQAAMSGREPADSDLHTLVERQLGKALDKAERLPEAPPVAQEDTPAPEPERREASTQRLREQADHQRSTLQMLRQTGTPEAELAVLASEVKAADNVEKRCLIN